MSTLNTRIYRDYGDAVNAVNRLHKKKFNKNFVFLISNAENHTSESDGTLEERIAKAGIPASDATSFAEFIQQGYSLVAVHAPWGESLNATTIMDKFSPEKITTANKKYQGPTFLNGSPFSTFFDIPLLSKDPTPFATFWNMPSIVRSSTPFSNWIGIPSIWRQPSVEKSLFGMPKLLRSKQSLSSWYNLPMLTKTARPFSQFFRMPELTRISTPFSAFFRVPSLINQKGWDAQVQGWPKLTKSGTIDTVTKTDDTTFPSDGVHKLGRVADPLSSTLGLPTVSRRSWTVSGLLGIPLLVKSRKGVS